MKSAQRNVLGDIALGALAGVAATWIMGKATTYLYEHENEAARKREDEARDGKSAYETAAEKAALLVVRELSDDERKKLGSAIHWSIGLGSTVLYALLRRRLAGRGLGAELAAGALFGTAVWLLMDEIGNVALGLTPGPTAFPWQAHARGLAGHLVLGLTAEGVMQAADLAA
ncbi:MAG TPA: DUF1440 domain-containing protein [Thermoanaerobaculia bacterium]|nr:DUF1440 domain-containing protein [Thermoanaerobaculia bacterium]